MNETTKPQQGPFSGLGALYKRLAGVNLLSPTVVASALLSHTLTLLAFEMGRVQGNAWQILQIGLLSEAVFLGAFFIGIALQRTRLMGKIALAWNSITIITLSHIAKVLVLEFGLFEAGLVAEFRPQDRIAGDVSVSVIFLLGIAYVLTASRELGEQQLELERARTQLAQQAKDSISSAKETEELLRTKAKDAIGLQLEQILKSLKSKSANAKKLSIEISSLIQNKVRPLSQEIWNQATNLENQQQLEVRPVRRRLPSRIVPSEDFQPGFVLLIAGTNIFLTTPGLSRWGYAVIFGLVMLSYLGLAELIKAVIPKKLSLPLWLGSFYVLVVSYLAWIPTRLFLLVSEERYPQLRVLSTTASGMIGTITIVLAIWWAYKRSNREYIAELAKLNDQKNRNITLMEQAIWLARRNWSFLVHGTVQGALTVALSRLQLSGSLTQELIGQVEQDIVRAKAVLEKKSSISSSWRVLYPQIVQTWDGVCEVKVVIEPNAKKVLNASRFAATCTSEILKEVVGNAFRHGGATKVQSEISLSESGDLLVVCTNNGTPYPDHQKLGIGSQLFDELTTSWTRANGSAGPSFSATIPVATRL